MKSWMKEFFKRRRGSLPKWVNVQNLVFFLVIMAFIIIILWSENISHYLVSVHMRNGSITPTPTILPGTPTPPLPAEYIASSNQTSGIIFGVLIVLVTIVFGTVWILLKARKEPN